MNFVEKSLKTFLNNYNLIHFIIRMYEKFNVPSSVFYSYLLFHQLDVQFICLAHLQPFLLELISDTL